MLNVYSQCPACGYRAGMPNMPYPMAGAAPTAPTGIALATQILIGAGGLLALLSIPSSVFNYTVAQRILDNGGIDGGNWIAPVMGILGLLWILLVPVSIAAGVLFIVWLSKSAKLSAILAPGRQKLSPGWAVGGWFIPLAYLVLPRIVVGDVWRASEPLREQPATRPPRTVLVSFWWIAFVIGQQFLFSDALSDPDDALQDATNAHGHTYFLTVMVVSVLVSTLRLASAVLAIVMLRKITTRQQVRILQGPGPGHPYAAMAPQFAGAPYGQPQYPYQYPAPAPYPAPQPPQPYQPPVLTPPAPEAPVDLAKTVTDAVPAGPPAEARTDTPT